MAKDDKYEFTYEKPEIKYGKYNGGNVGSSVRYLKVFLADDQVRLGYNLELTDSLGLIVNMMAYTDVKKKDGGNVQMDMMIATLSALNEGLNMYCEEYMKETYNYIFVGNLNVPSKEEIEVILREIPDNRN